MEERAGRNNETKIKETIQDIREEKIILVDIFDETVGHEYKLKTHQQGLLHRAFSVFLWKEDKMFIQKRAQEKYHSGGLWANACCSHPREGETLEEAVKRRMKEELGIETEVTEQFSFVYREVFENGLTEYEFDHVFLGKYEGEIELNPEEASEGTWIDLKELAQSLQKEPEKYSVWFLSAAPRVLQILKDLRANKEYV